MNEPAMFREDQASSLLDLVLSNEELMVTDMQSLPGLSSSDHVLLKFEFNCFIDVHTGSFIIPTFFKGDYVSMNQALPETDWSATLGGLTLSEFWDYFAEKK